MANFIYNSPVQLLRYIYEQRLISSASVETVWVLEMYHVISRFWNHVADPVRMEPGTSPLTMFQWGCNTTAEQLDKRLLPVRSHRMTEYEPMDYRGGGFLKYLSTLP